MLMKRAILHIPSIPKNKGQFLTHIARGLRESSGAGTLHYGLGSRKVLIRTSYINQGHLGWVAEAGRVKENVLWKSCKATLCAAYELSRESYNGVWPDFQRVYNLIVHSSKRKVQREGLPPVATCTSTHSTFSLTSGLVT